MLNKNVYILQNSPYNIFKGLSVMQCVRHLVETKLKQNAKASKINAFIKNGVDPIARSNNTKRSPKAAFFALLNNAYLSFTIRLLKHKINAG